MIGPNDNAINFNYLIKTLRSKFVYKIIKKSINLDGILMIL